MRRVKCHRHDPAPLSLYNQYTNRSGYIPDDQSCGQRNNSQTESPCLDKAVSQGGHSLLFAALFSAGRLAHMEGHGHARLQVVVGATCVVHMHAKISHS